MDTSFVATRSRELDTYLNSLLQLPRIRSSQLLASFLSDTSNPALFMPDTMGERAGVYVLSFSFPLSLCLPLSSPNGQKSRKLEFYCKLKCCSIFSGKMIKSVPVPGRKKEVATLSPLSLSLFPPSSPFLLPFLPPSLPFSLPLLNLSLPLSLSLSRVS